MPAASSRAMPVPTTRLSGSIAPTMTFVIPAAMIASVHGGVRPWWLHGSSVTTMWAPEAADPAS